MQDNLESKIKTYNEKSFQHSQNWKKIHALINYSKAIDDFHEWEALEFIIRYFTKDYLDPAQESFLDYVLTKYGISTTNGAIRPVGCKSRPESLMMSIPKSKFHSLI